MNKQTGAAVLLAWQKQIERAVKCEHSGKRKYATIEEAERKRDYLNHATGTRGSVYRCRHCGSFHMTRQRPPLGDKSAFLGVAPPPNTTP